MTKSLLIVFLFGLSLAALATTKAKGDYPETGTVVDSPQHLVYVIETATTRYTIFGKPTLALHETIHFRLEKRMKGFVLADNSKEDHYYLNGQQDVSVPYRPAPAGVPPAPARVPPAEPKPSQSGSAEK